MNNYKQSISKYRKGDFYQNYTLRNGYLLADSVQIKVIRKDDKKTSRQLIGLEKHTRKWRKVVKKKLQRQKKAVLFCYKK